MLMQLKPGRHGSDSDVHSLISTEVGVGGKEPGTAPPQAPESGSRAKLGGSKSWAPDQCRLRLWVILSHPCPMA